MKKDKILYETIAKNAKSGKQAYEIVYFHLLEYASLLLDKKNIPDDDFAEDILTKLFESEFDNYGGLTEEEAYRYISNIIDNEIILANYRKRCKEEMFD